VHHIDGGTNGWDKSAWALVLDGVMGGRSTGRASYQDNTMTFSGTISLNGGGFSSVRRSLPTTDFSSYAGIVVEFYAQQYVDSSSYPLGVHVQLGDRTSSWNFASALAVPLAKSDGKKVSIFLPMSSFDKASRSGWNCHWCKLDPTTVYELAIYVLFQEGNFELKLYSMYAVETAAAAPAFVPPVLAMDQNAVVALVQATIGSGATLYDKGYKGLCVAQYASASRSIVAATGVSSTIKAVACAGLTRAVKGEKVEDAWALRRAFDAILADAKGQARPLKGHYPSYVQDDFLPAVGATLDGDCNAATLTAINFPMGNMRSGSAGNKKANSDDEDESSLLIGVVVAGSLILCLCLILGIGFAVRTAKRQTKRLPEVRAHEVDKQAWQDIENSEIDNGIIAPCTQTGAVIVVVGNPVSTPKENR
jgi:hypothetical protein